jgi:hypothetical protein
MDVNETSQTPQTTRHAIVARNIASARVRKLTAGAVAATTALAGVFAALAAGSSPTKKVVRRSAGASSGQPALPAPHVSAPSATAPGSSAPTPPDQVPTPTVQPPVAVSGGS